jgi:hypothetical protein
MIKDKKKLKAMSLKGRKSPKTGKHGKRKTTLIFEQALKDRAEKIMDDLIIERSRMLGGMKKKMTKAKFRDLVDGVDKFTKNIQLLGGKDTGKITFEWKK